MQLWSVGILVASAALAAAEEKFSATCPVSGKPAKEACNVEHNGKKVYFCCGNCPKQFKADSAKYTAKTNLQLLQTKQIAQFACPFTGKVINPDTKVTVEGTGVCFCCENCQGKFSKAEDKVACVFAKIGKGFTTQTACPVSGKPIDMEHSATHDGRKVFFCCPNCPKAFAKNPDKFAKKLPPAIQ
jgi:YHS domain-containing protein